MAGTATWNSPRCSHPLSAPPALHRIAIKSVSPFSWSTAEECQQKALYYAQHHDGDRNMEQSQVKFSPLRPLAFHCQFCRLVVMVHSR